MGEDDALELCKEYFYEFCLAMDHLLEADEQILKSFLRSNRYSIYCDDTVQGLVDCFGRRSRLSMIALPNLRLLFLALIENGKQRKRSRCHSKKYRKSSSSS